MTEATTVGTTEVTIGMKAGIITAGLTGEDPRLRTTTGEHTAPDLALAPTLLVTTEDQTSKFCPEDVNDDSDEI